MSRFDLHLFFDTADGDDPAIFRIIEEDQAPPEKVFDSFSDWLNDYVQGEINGYKDIEQFRYVMVSLNNGVYTFEKPGFFPVSIELTDTERLKAFMHDAGIESIESIKPDPLLECMPLTPKKVFSESTAIGLTFNF